MKKIDLLLTRHGETIENQRHVLQGQLPGTLSPLGKEQAVNFNHPELNHRWVSLDKDKLNEIIEARTFGCNRM